MAESSLEINFRYLVHENIYDELTDIAKNSEQENDLSVKGWILANRRDNFAIISKYIITDNDYDSHCRPKSWMRLKKRKLWMMRKLKKDYDIPWEFHTHSGENEELHDIDIKILNYFTSGVMIIITPSNIVGWYFKKKYQKKKSIMDKMIFEVIST